MGGAWELLLFLLLVPSRSLALEYCDELWFTRNLIFHNGGHCFSSPLGKAVFGNESCDSGGVTVLDKDRAFIARLRAAEAEEGCKVDTSRTIMPVIMPEARKALVDHPFPTLYESSCIGWLGERVTLHKGRDTASDVTGAIRKGDTMLFQFEDVGDWTFVEVMLNGITAAMGWAQIELGEESCAMVAG